MKEERFDDLMRDAAETYHRPPEPSLDEMWQVIESSLREHDTAGQIGVVAGTVQAPRHRRWTRQWLGIAAALVIGIGLGRLWTIRGGTTTGTDSTHLASGFDSPRPGEMPASRPGLNEPYDRATTRYLGQTAALLIALPNEVRAGRTDAQFTARAGDLLLTTRLLLDSPASNDPAMRNLLEDLELVLAQVVRLRSERAAGAGTGHTELDLINQALEQRDVMPRLQSAVAADISADDE